MENEAKIRQLESQLEELTREFNKLRSSSTISYDIGEAIKDRIGVTLTAGTPNTTTSGQFINESGAASYTVASLMTGFVPVTINGITYNLPYY